MTSRVKRWLHRKGKKIGAIALSLSMLVGNVATSVGGVTENYDAEFNIEQEVFEDAVFDSLKKAPVDQGMEFVGSPSEMCADLFGMLWDEDTDEVEPDGTLYEIALPEKYEKDNGLEITVYMKLDKAIDELMFDGVIDSPADYVPDGSEQVIFLIKNETSHARTATIQIGDHITDKITVAAKSKANTQTKAPAAGAGGAAAGGSAGTGIIGNVIEKVEEIIDSVIGGTEKAEEEIASGESTAEETLAEDASAETVGDAAAEDAADATVTEGAAGETVTEGVADETAAEDAAGNIAAEDAADATVTEDAAGETVTEGVADETVTEDASDETATEDTAVESDIIIEHTAESASDAANTKVEIISDTEETEKSAETSEEPAEADDTASSDDGVVTVAEVASVSYHKVVRVFAPAEGEEITEAENTTEEKIAADDSAVTAGLIVAESEETATPSEIAAATPETEVAISKAETDKNLVKIEGDVLGTVEIGEAKAVIFVTKWSAIKYEEVIEYPEFSAKKAVDGVTVSLHADEGVIPEGTTVEIEDLTEQLSEAILSQYDNAAGLFAYDINLIYKGKKLDNGWNENGNVTVTFAGSTIKTATDGAETVEIFTITDEEVKKVLESEAEDFADVPIEIDTVDVQNLDGTENSVSFEAEHFTLYGGIALAAENNLGADTPTDLPSILVEKEFIVDSLTDEEKEELYNNFEITVRKQGEGVTRTLKLSDDDVIVEKDDENHFYWRLEGDNYREGTYIISENNAELDGFTLEKTVIGEDYVDNKDGTYSVTTKAPSVKASCTRYNSNAAAEMDTMKCFGTNDISLLAFAFTPRQGIEPEYQGHFVIWTKNRLDGGERTEAIKAVKAVGGNIGKISEEKTFFYSDDDIAEDKETIKTGIVIGKYTISYNSDAHMINLKNSSVWTQVAYGKFERTAGINASLGFSNEYTKDETSITLKKIVTGNMAETSDNAFKFSISVDGEAYSGDYTKSDESIETDGADVYLADGQSVTIKVPYGAELRISEAANSDGYIAYYGEGDAITSKEGLTKGNTYTDSEITEEDDDKVITFVNDKTSAPPTGINTHSTPYLLMMAFSVMVGGLWFFSKKSLKPEM